MFETILVPTDGSEYAESAAEMALELAKTHDAAVHVLSVADTGPLESIRLPGDAASPEGAFRARAERAVETIVSRGEETGLEMTGTVRTGPAESEILEYATEVDADLIVMGTRGRGGVTRAALGSVTDHVVRLGDVPVFIPE
ncbi:universal stress protein [Natrarchaeobius halalkaliphilus]|uniref:Universal stress protein n=1 Tax=Natrarchaeobius halalkaliphilus TaxID=1679091 RepID=A0A3N6LME7_9EURY|nr:universal stress protein [Natrarchaeobius halalkaliphilus]RQG90188.1 universal stress protein [Natrarchaeobius halalkaliphilus]